MSDNLISIKIMDKIYKIKCPPEHAQELQEAAACLDEQMKKIRKAGNFNNLDRIAIVAALNISHELILLKKQKVQQIEAMNERIQDIHSKIQNFLAIEEPVAV